MSEKLQMLLRKKQEKLIDAKLNEYAPHLYKENSFVEMGITDALVEQLKINYSKISDEDKRFYDVSEEKVMLSNLEKKLDLEKFEKAILLIENESFWYGIQVDITTALKNINGIIAVDKNSLRLISMDGIHFIMIDLHENALDKWQYEVTYA